MSKRNPSTLIIDSRDRTGPLSYDAFSITVSPAIAGATKVRLLFASIGIPLLSTEPYYLIRCPQLGIGVRSAAGSSGTTFVIPVDSQPGYRTLFGSQSECGTAVAQENGLVASSIGGPSIVVVVGRVISASAPRAPK